MSSIAILYGTTEGQTAQIAQRMAGFAAALGYAVECHDVQMLSPNFRLDAFDGVIVGASIHVGKHSPEITDFVKEHQQELESVPSAFFSVSLSAAGKTERQQENARRCLEEFLRETEWSPQKTAIFAGALLYRKYGLLKRYLMRWIAQQEGGDTDTSRNYEYTDWEQVHGFAREFLGQFEEDRA